MICIARMFLREVGHFHFNFIKWPVCSVSLKTMTFTIEYISVSPDRRLFRGWRKDWLVSTITGHMGTNTWASIYSTRLLENNVVLILSSLLAFVSKNWSIEIGTFFCMFIDLVEVKLFISFKVNPLASSQWHTGKQPLANIVELVWLILVYSPNKLWGLWQTCRSLIMSKT